jgi:hypothetical protein
MNIMKVLTPTNKVLFENNKTVSTANAILFAPSRTCLAECNKYYFTFQVSAQN